MSFIQGLRTLNRKNEIKHVKPEILPLFLTQILGLRGRPCLGGALDVQDAAQRGIPRIRDHPRTTTRQVVATVL